MATISGRGLVEAHGDSPDRGPPHDEIEHGLLRLETLGESLRIIGRVNASLAGVALSLLLWSGLGEATLKLFTHTVSREPAWLVTALPVACVMGLLCSFVGIISLVAWERRRRTGGTLFMKLSDELESRHRLANAGAIPQQSESDSARIRGLFRTYLQAATLPLMRDDSSAATYLMFHVVFVVVFVQIAFLLL